MTTNDPLILSPRSNISVQADGVVLQHHVAADESFAQASNNVFALLRKAQLEYPGVARGLVIAIEGHKGEAAGYDEDFFEFQQEFMLGALGKYLTWIDMPLTGKLKNPAPQDDDVPDRLRVQMPDA